MGGGPFDEPLRADDKWHAPGPMSQIAVFERLADAPTPGPTGGEGLAELVWASGEL